jgi:DNA-binding response OmpR family regulator
MKAPLATIVLLADRRQSQTAKSLKGSGYRVLTTFTPDHAVAVCVNTLVRAVILDQDHFIQTDGWSVAQSLKMIRNNICVILVVRGRVLREKVAGRMVPAGVDAVVPEQDDQRLLAVLKQLLDGP